MPSFQQIVFHSLLVCNLGFCFIAEPRRLLRSSDRTVVWMLCSRISICRHDSAASLHAWAAETARDEPAAQSLVPLGRGAWAPGWVVAHPHCGRAAHRKGTFPLRRLLAHGRSDAVGA